MDHQASLGSRKLKLPNVVWEEDCPVNPSPSPTVLRSHDVHARRFLQVAVSPHAWSLQMSW